MSMVIVKDAYRSPFARQDELGKAVAIQVAPDCSRHQANCFKQSRVCFIQLEVAVFESINARTNRFWISSTLYLAAHKQVQVAVTVQVAQRHGSDALRQI